MALVIGFASSLFGKFINPRTLRTAASTIEMSWFPNSLHARTQVVAFIGMKCSPLHTRIRRRACHQKSTYLLVQKSMTSIFLQDLKYLHGQEFLSFPIKKSQDLPS
jgi:hypothetical protein